MKNKSEMAKRIFDVVVVGVLLLFLWPLLILIALSVAFALGRPVFFVQIRPGLNGAPFKMYKFRSMCNATNSEGHPLDDALRLTRFGRFLRATSLDELPELWNVLVGDMSLVGPRPLLMEYIPLYTSEQMRRHEVLPGVTGWAQVNGRNAISWEEKFSLDVWYIDHHSFMLDLKILALTISRVLRPSDINQPGATTMSKFVGSLTEKVPDA